MVFTGSLGDLTLVLGLVVERERLCAALYAQYCTRVTRVGLDVSVAVMLVHVVLLTT